MLAWFVLSTTSFERSKPLDWMVMFCLGWTIIKIFSFSIACVFFSWFKQMWENGGLLETLLVNYQWFIMFDACRIWSSLCSFLYIYNCLSRHQVRLIGRHIKFLLLIISYILYKNFAKLPMEERIFNMEVHLLLALLVISDRSFLVFAYKKCDLHELWMSIVRCTIYCSEFWIHFVNLYSM